MPYETTSYKLLQILGFNEKEIIEYIKPFGYRPPNTRAEYNQLCQDIRRQLRLLEQHPGNIGTYLHGPSFYINTGATDQTQTYFTANSNQHQSFYQADSQHDSTAYTYNTHADESSMETSSCTSSDQGEEQLADEQGNLTFDPIAQSGPHYGERVFMTYTQARKAWRRFSHKPIRKVRRFLKRKGK